MLIPHPILDLGGDERDTVLVAGTGRSGTTWVGELLARMMRSRLIFEPFLMDDRREFVTVKGWFLPKKHILHDAPLYLRPEENSESPYFAPTSRILSGRVHNGWCDIGVRPGVYRRRLIKEIRANLFLAYLADTWPDLKIIWIVRDVLSVIQSQTAMVKMYGWHFDWQAEQALADERLVSDWLDPYVPLMRRAATLPERLAHRWSIETMVPAWQEVQERKNVLFVRYDELTHSAAAWQRVADFVAGGGWSESDFQRALDRRSSTSQEVVESKRHAGRRPDLLSERDEAAIHEITEAYGAAAFYRGAEQIAGSGNAIAVPANAQPDSAVVETPSGG